MIHYNSTIWLFQAEGNLAAKLTGKILVWEEQKAKLKLCRTEWSDGIKIMERKLSADETITNILTWIADKNDPEPTLEDIRLKVNSDDRYGNCARWFFDGDEFQGWSKGFKALESEHEYKQALWIRGDYGTGKTTLMSAMSLLCRLFLICIQVPRCFNFTEPSEQPFSRRGPAGYTLLLRRFWYSIKEAKLRNHHSLHVQEAFPHAGLQASRASG